MMFGINVANTDVHITHGMYSNAPINLNMGKYTLSL